MRLSLITFSVLPLMRGGTFFWRARARDAYRDVRQAISRINARLAENINGVRVVQAFSREELNLRMFDGSQRAQPAHEPEGGDGCRRSSSPRVDFANAPAVATVDRLRREPGVCSGSSRRACSWRSCSTWALLPAHPRHGQRYNTLLATMASGERIFQVLDRPAERRDKPGAPRNAAGRGRRRLR